MISKLFDSKRTGHMTAAIVTGIVVFAAGTQVNDPLLQNLTQMTAGVIPLWELIATPDMDHNGRKMGGPLFRSLWVLFWSLYRALVPHRSRWSHSLLFGTPARIIYVYGLPALMARQWWDEILNNDAILLCVPFLVAPFVADTVHLLKDNYLYRYGVKGMIVGK